MAGVMLASALRVTPSKGRHAASQPDARTEQKQENDAMLEKRSSLTRASLAVLVMLLAALGAWAAEQDDASDGDGDSGEIFVPTEEISEDFPAPFPVDI